MYTKLFTKILDSSIWLEATPTRICWITLLAAMDEDGIAHFSAVENLAIRARVSIAEAQKAVETFMAPDPNSSNPANEGRRVERIPGGFLILNAEYHRNLMNRVVQREQNRERVARFRERNKTTVTSPLQNITPVSVYTSEFESFWDIYPIHKAKGQAFRAWQKLSPDSTLQASILISIQNQKSERAHAKLSGGFVPDWKYAGTWLNQRCWEDEPIKVEHNGQAQSRKLSGPEQVERATAERKREREQKLIG